MPADWSLDEVELIVADYFAMLRDELAGDPVNKADHNRRLRAQLNNRSKGSVEFKYANISAVLLQLDDLPYIDGYKPRSNYQRRLEQAVLEYLTIDPDFFERVAASPIVQPALTPVTDFEDLDRLVEAPPDRVPSSPLTSRDPIVRKVDFVRQDAENRRLGRLGEEWALEFERRRLHDVERRPDLAKRVEWVADTRGDGLGYDIVSFDRDASPRLIEVKTTGLGKYFPFVVTGNEVRVSEREAGHYHLYRVFRFATDPRLYMLQGSFSVTCHLDPTQYRARAGR